MRFVAFLLVMPVGAAVLSGLAASGCGTVPVGVVPQEGFGTIVETYQAQPTTGGVGLVLTIVDNKTLNETIRRECTVTLVPAT